MARPIKYDDEALLESLRASFLALGPGVSSAELARRAGVSEGTLFKRFGTKRRLFELALRLPTLEDKVWFRDLLQQAGRGSLQANLAALSAAIMEHMAEVTPVMETLIVSGFKPRDLAADEDEKDIPPLVLQRRVAKYLESEMKLGRLRKIDGRTLTDLLLGACVKHAFERAHFGTLFTAETTDQIAQRIARGFVELAAPEPAPKPARAPAARR